ncbi:hypothetical protein FI667_g9459, partial [Globisporangium splendens]
MTAKRARDDAQALAAAVATPGSSSGNSTTTDKRVGGSVAAPLSSSSKEPQTGDRNVMDGDAVTSPSSRLAKRRRSNSDGNYEANDNEPASHRQSVASSTGGSEDGGASLQQETLRISNELLRAENQHLQEDIATLTTAKSKLEAQVTTSAKRIRDLEADVARLYRGRKKDAQEMQREHDLAIEKLQQQLNEATRQQKDVEASSTKRDALLPVVSASTAQEMDAYLATCLQWQSKLTGLSVELTEKVARIKEDEVQSVLCELVAKVEMSEREQDVREREHEVQALRVSMQQQQHDVQQVVQRLQRERAETDAFTALERRVLEDRVAELETQLTQITFEKDEEITSLRAERERIDAELKRKNKEADEWRQKCELQDKQTTRLQDELRTLNSEMQRLEEQVQNYQKQEETRAFEALEKRILEERIEELESQLRTVESKQEAEHEAMRNALETEKQALTESLEAVQLELSVAAAEATVKKNEVARLLNDKMELKKQMKAFAADWRKLASQLEECKAQCGEQQAYAAQLKEAVATLQQVNETLRGGGETADKVANDEIAQLQQQNEALKEKERALAREGAQKEEKIQHLVAKEQETEQRMATEIARLQSQNQQLISDLEAKRSNDDQVHDSPTATDETELVARLTHEKRAIQEFFRCYFEAAETKCRELMQQLSQQQAQSALHRQQAQDSCQTLRMCTQVDSCDESVRNSILDVVSTLERIS